MAAMVMIDAVIRLRYQVCWGMNEVRLRIPSRRETGLLEGPQYTRPRQYRGYDVPEVLLSGDHEGDRPGGEKNRVQKENATGESGPDQPGLSHSTIIPDNS